MQMGAGLIAIRPASKWLPLALLLLALLLLLQHADFGLAATDFGGSKFKIIRDQHVKPKQNNNSEQLESSESSSFQALASPITPIKTAKTTAPASKQSASQKLHKFAYDISLNKRIREQQAEELLDRGGGKRRKNDKLIKQQPSATISSNYDDQQQQQQTREKRKTTTRVPSLFFDDDDVVAGAEDNQQIGTSKPPPTTTTLATDNLLVMIYGDRSGSGGGNGSDLLSLTTEKYQPQVETTLESQHEKIYNRSSHHLQRVGDGSKSSIIQVHDFTQYDELNDDSNDRDQEQTLRSFDARPVVGQQQEKLRPILLTSGIKVTSELNFMKDNNNSNNNQLETKNLAGSLRAVGGGGQQSRSTPSEQQQQSIGLFGSHLSSLTADPPEPQQKSVSNKLARRTSELPPLPPTRLVFGLTNDDNLPSELYPSSSSSPTTKNGGRPTTVELFGLNRIGGQFNRQGEQSIEDEETSYHQPTYGDNSDEVFWQPPSSMIRRTQSNGGLAKGAAKNHQLAQTSSSSAIRVVASDSSVPLVINNHGLITAAKLSNPMTRKWLKQTSLVKHKSPVPATDRIKPNPTASVIRRPFVPQSAATEVALPQQQSTLVTLDDLEPTSLATNSGDHKNSIANFVNSSYFEDQQSWSFNPNPPYKQSNFSFSSTPASIQSTVGINITTTSQAATTTRPSIETRRTTSKRPAAAAATTTTLASWTQDLGSSSSSYSHQHVTGADSVYDSAAGDQIRPPVNNQSTVIERPAAQNIRHKLQNMLKQKLISHKKQSPAAGATSSAFNSTGTMIKRLQLSTPPPLLSSTVANNVANLLTQTLGSLIMRQTNQQQQSAPSSPFFKPPNLLGSSAGQRIRQRLGMGKTSAASLNRRATSVGSLLFSGFIYGLSVLPALMAITGVNPLSGDTGGARQQQQPRSSRKTGAQKPADKKLVSPVVSTIPDANKILLASLPFPYVMSHTDLAPAPAFFSNQPPTGSMLDGGPIESAADSTAAALLDPMVHAGDYTTQASALGSFSNLHPLIEEPSSFDELRSSPTNMSSSSSLSHNRHFQHTMGDDRDSDQSASMDLEHSMRWRDAVDSAPSSPSRKVQRDLTNWQQQSSNRGLTYGSDKSVDNFVFRSPMPNQQQQHQDHATRHWPPSSAANAHNSQQPFGPVAASSSQPTTSDSQQVVPMSQQSSNSQARYPTNDEQSPMSSTQQAFTRLANSNANANNMRDLQKYVSPATTNQQQQQSWPMEGDKSQGSSNGQQLEQPQQQPLSSGSNQYRQRQPPIIAGHSQWQNNQNNYPAGGPTATANSNPAAAAAAEPSLDFALLGPYEPFLALKPQPQPQQISLLNGGGGGGYSQPSVLDAGYSGLQQLAPLPYKNTYRWNKPPTGRGDSTSRHQSGFNSGESYAAAGQSYERPYGWSRSRRQRDDSDQWKVISQPVVRSSSGAYNDGHDTTRQRKHSHSTRRLGDDLVSRWQRHQQLQVVSGPEATVSRSIAIGDK